MAETIFLETRSELIPKLKDLVEPVIKEKGLNSNIYIIAGTGSDSKYIRRSLSRALGCMIGITIGSSTSIINGLNRKKMIPGSIRELMMLRALQEMHPELIEGSDKWKYASSFINKFDTIRKHQIEIDMSEDQDLFEDYLNRVHDEGYLDDIEFMEGVQFPDCDLLIVLDIEAVNPFIQYTMDKWAPVKKVEIAFKEDLRGPGERVIEGKKIELCDIPDNVNYSRFSKRSDEHDSISKKVRWLLDEGERSDDIAICIPTGSIEDLVRDLDEVGVGSDHQYSIPILGIPTTETVENLLDLICTPKDPVSLLKLIKDPLVDDKAKGDLGPLFPLLNGFIKRWFIERPSDLKRAV